jgi:hypothetical protein
MTPAIDKLVAANLIVRKGHGNFDIADPFVKQVWLRHAQMRQTLIRASGSQGIAADGTGS